MPCKQHSLADVYYGRYKSFALAIRHLLADREIGEHIEPRSRFDNAVALLAVHGAISLTDAILSGYSDGPNKERDHERAADRLKKLCGQERLKPDGIAHLAKLLGAKADVAYGDRMVRESQAKSLVLALERYAAWVAKHFVDLGKEM